MEPAARFYVPANQRSVLRLPVYLLVIAICIPTNLYSTSLLGDRQLLVPLATLLLVLAWVVFTYGRCVAVRGAMGIIWGALAFFVVLAVISSVRHPNTAQSLSLVVVYIERLIMTFVLVQVLVIDNVLFVRLQRLFVIMLAVVALLMISGLLDRFGHNVLVNTLASDQQIARLSAGLGDPNFTALAFNVGLAIALAWFAAAERRSHRVTATVAALLLVTGIARTVSIGGLIGMVVILLLSMSWMAKFRGHGKWKLIGLSAGILTVIVAVAGGLYMERIHQQAARSEHSISAVGTERLNLTVGGLRMAWAYPLLGVGPANTGEFMPDYLLVPITENTQESHNGFIDVMDEIGIPACLMLLIVIILTLKIAFHTRRRLLKMGARMNYLSGAGAFIALIATLVQTFALGTQRNQFFWLVVALVLSSSWHALRTPVQFDTVPRAS